MELKLTRCTIRDWLPEDGPSIVQHANNWNVWVNLRDSFPHPYTLQDWEAWFRSVKNATPAAQFAIVVDGAAVGAIGLHFKRDVYRRSAEIGYWLGEAYWGKGIMTEALMAVTDYAFSKFGLCRIYAGVFEGNVASMKVLEKAGYAFEARLKKNVTKNGKTLDEFLYAKVRA
jgi:ribosomal-protein-alanine N-acetyltransferase